MLGLRLKRIYELVVSTKHVARFVVFGSFITDKPEPKDLDIVLVMDDSFEVSELTGAARLLFDHQAADDRFGASVFWVRRPVAFGGEQAMVEHWQVKRDGSRRGIIEIGEQR